MSDKQTPQEQTQGQAEEHFDWESRLEKIRENRKQVPYTHGPLLKHPASNAPQSEEETRKLDAKERDRVLREYLLQWQKEHNEEVEKEEKVETDTEVLLQENWLNAQASLQMAASDKQVESTRTVWLKPKSNTVEFPTAAEVEAAAAADHAAEEGYTGEPRINVRLNVLNPQVNTRREVTVLSESELLERLTDKIRPHLTDAVNGMIRVAVQKQMALLTLQLQQILQEQAPSVVDEVLEYNLKKVMSEIKYDLKYKRNDNK